MLRIGALLLTFFFTSFLIAQNNRTVPHSFIVSFENDIDCSKILKKHQLPTEKVEKISEMLHLWRIDSDGSDSEALFLKKLNALPEVKVAQQNHYIEHRQNAIFHKNKNKNGSEAQPGTTLPNDPNFSQQHYLLNTGQNGGTSGADLNMVDAWQHTTGGLNSIGDEIVVCVIDHGFDKTHADLAPNLWQNQAEIPSNGIDDDGNGYIDDVLGWNTFGANDDILGLGLTHGTQVTGIIGAKGDNGLDITGINWDIQIQCLVAGLTEDKLLAAYGYAYKNRKMYNESHGQSGAYVVATTASMGTAYGQAADAPLWCSVFDALGSVGILNCAPAPNEAVDVDSAGDLPTTCPSDYLLTSTALDNQDNLHVTSGWGATSIDFGAYGKDVHTLSPNQTCSTVSGTSFSAPQIAAAIALLYSGDCSDLPALSRDNPSDAALEVRSILFENSTELTDLQSLTHSKGKLNIGASLDSYLSECSFCTPPFDVYAIERSYSALSIHWAESSNSFRTDIRFRPAGLNVWFTVHDYNPPFELTNMDTCSTIEVQLRSWCDGEQGVWSASKFFASYGCCLPPSDIHINATSEDELSIKWNAENSTKGFSLRYKEAQSSAWTIVESDERKQVLSALLPCTTYEIQVKANCAPMGWSHSYFGKTKGCGACTDHTYCDNHVGSALSEYIERIEIGTWSHSVGSGPGYQSFASSAAGTAIDLPIGVPVPIKLTPGFVSGGLFKEYFRVFLDLNHDGIFDENECVFDPGYACYCPVEGILNIDPNVALGTTRMRVLMQFHDSPTDIPEPCVPIEFGQVADYCVTLGQASTSTDVEKKRTESMRIYPNPSADFIFIEKENTNDSRYAIVDAKGRNLKTIELTAGQSPTRVDISELKNGIYFIHQIDGQAVERLRFVVLR